MDPADRQQSTEVHRRWTSTVSGVALLAFLAFVLWLLFGQR